VDTRPAESHSGYNSKIIENPLSRALEGAFGGVSGPGLGPGKFSICSRDLHVQSSPHVKGHEIGSEPTSESATTKNKHSKTSLTHLEGFRGLSLDPESSQFCLRDLLVQSSLMGSVTERV
jgi:hypothetical protein